jgi:hypothetical protein
MHTISQPMYSVGQRSLRHNINVQHRSVSTCKRRSTLFFIQTVVRQSLYTNLLKKRACTQTHRPKPRPCTQAEARQKTGKLTRFTRAVPRQSQKPLALGQTNVPSHANSCTHPVVAYRHVHTPSSSPGQAACVRTMYVRTRTQTNACRECGHVRLVVYYSGDW